MATGTYDGSGKIYHTIAEGKIKRKAEEGADGAKLRKYETTSGESGEKWEYSFDFIEGIITNIVFADGKYGQTMQIHFHDDNILSVGVKTRYFSSIARRIPNLDFKQSVRIVPYNFESEGKKLVGISVYQDDKVADAFYDNVGKKNLKGIPEPTDEDKRDWAFYYQKVDKWLVSYLAANVLPEFDGVQEPEPESKTEPESKKEQKTPKRANPEPEDEFPFD